MEAAGVPFVMEDAGGGSVLRKSSKKQSAVELPLVPQVQREVVLWLVGQCYLRLVLVGHGVAWCRGQRDVSMVAAS